MATMAARVRSLRIVLVLCVLTSWFSCLLGCQMTLADVFHLEKPAFSLDSKNSCPDGDHDDVCGWMASGGYETKDHTILLNVPDVASPFLNARDIVGEGEPPRNQWSRRVEIVPPEFPGTWHFSLRSALQPRAPSLHS